MIVRMKKLTLLCTRNAQERTLESLRALGAVHLEHVRPPADEPVEKARQHFDYLRRALEVLPKHSAAPPSGRPPHEAIDEIWKLIHHRQALEEKIELLELERRRYEPFGDFSPEAVRDLAEQGVTVRLGKAPVRDMPEIPAGVSFVDLSRDRSTVYFALIARGNIDLEFDEVPLCGYSLSGFMEHLGELREELADTDEKFHAFSGDRGEIAATVQEAEDAVNYLEARAGMGRSEEVAYLRGFLPAAQEKDLRRLAAAGGWAVLLEEPGPDDKVPTLIRHAKWVRTIKPLLDMVNLTPGYREVDISPAFLIFFSLFFGMLVGDAGYGLLFLAVTTACRLKFKSAPRTLFNLLTVTSAATIVWGSISGVWFGIATVPPVLEKLHIAWLDDYYNIMGLCFFIGAVHLTLAHGWRAAVERRTPRLFAQIGWIGSTWAMFFVATNMICGWPLPGFAVPLLCASLVLIIAFMTPLRKLREAWINHAMLPLDVINNFVDVVSYLRLFAVGLATLEVAKAFNGMAAGTVWIAPIVLFVGHTMNIAMAIMGVMVHGLRLNALEFSNHIGLEWAGIKYNPFARVNKKEEINDA